MKKLSFFPKTLIILNLVGLSSLSLFIFNIWETNIHPFIKLYVVHDFLIYFTLFFIYYLWLQKLKQKQSLSFFIGLFFLFLGIFAMGMHVGTDQVHKLVTHPIAYFYDELLTHWIAFASFAILSFILVWLQFKKALSDKLSSLEIGIIFISGIFQGSVLGLGATEGHNSLIAVTLFPLFLAFMLYQLKGKKIKHYPLTIYYLTAYTFCLLFLAVWFILNKGFVEPSTNGFGRF